MLYIIIFHCYRLDPEGNGIDGSWKDPDRDKYAVDITPTSAKLRINRLDMNNMGVYSLLATNTEHIETLNFTLKILSECLFFLVLNFSIVPCDFILLT